MWDAGKHAVDEAQRGNQHAEIEGEERESIDWASNKITIDDVRV